MNRNLKSPISVNNIDQNKNVKQSTYDKIIHVLLKRLSTSFEYSNAATNYTLMLLLVIIHTKLHLSYSSFLSVTLKSKKLFCLYFLNTETTYFNTNSSIMAKIFFFLVFLCLLSLCLHMRNIILYTSTNYV